MNGDDALITLYGTDLRVSSLCLGTVGYGTGVSDEDAYRQLDIFARGGGNFIDTAHVYGDWGDRGPGLSERIIGQWLKRTGLRNQVILATKGAHPLLNSMEKPRLDEANIRLDLRQSLTGLGTDYIDLYILHRDDPQRPVEEILGVLEAAKARGEIRYYGCSNWTLPRLIEAQEAAARLGYQGFHCNQLMWSLADINYDGLWDSTMVPMDTDTFFYHQQSGLSAMAYMAIAKGYFSKLLHGAKVNDQLTELYRNDSNDTLLKILLSFIDDHYTEMDLCLLYFKVQPFPSIPIASFSSESQLIAAITSLDKECPEHFKQKVQSIKHLVYGYPSADKNGSGQEG